MYEIIYIEFVYIVFNFFSGLTFCAWISNEWKFLNENGGGLKIIFRSGRNEVEYFCFVSFFIK